MKRTAIVMITLSLIAAFAAVQPKPAQAVGLIREEKRELREDRERTREDFREVREDRKTILEQVRERVSSRAGELRNFFTNGRAAIGSGVIKAKTDTTLTVEKDGKTYTVNLSAQTHFRRRFWGKSALGEFEVGHTVNVIGKWTDDSHTTIDAVLVRDLSIQKLFGVFFGEVKSLVTNGWVMTTVGKNRPDQTVTVGSDTKIVGKDGASMTQADVKVGDRVRVKGLWDRVANTVTEVVHVKDFGVRATVTATVTATVAPTASPTSTPTP